MNDVENYNLELMLSRAFDSNLPPRALRGAQAQLRKAVLNQLQREEKLQDELVEAYAGLETLGEKVEQLEDELHTERLSAHVQRVAPRPRPVTRRQRQR
jgi:outer membrane protein TolC